jgi:hypothetical protein
MRTGRSPVGLFRPVHKEFDQGSMNSSVTFNFGIDKVSVV